MFHTRFFIFFRVKYTLINEENKGDYIMELLLSSLVVLGLGLFLLCYSFSLVNEEKQQWGVRRHKSDYDYDLVVYENSIFIDVR